MIPISVFQSRSNFHSIVWISDVQITAMINLGKARLRCLESRSALAKPDTASYLAVASPKKKYRQIWLMFF